MAILQIPVRAPLLAQRMVVTLDQSEFSLFFRFNRRVQRWYMDIGDADDNKLLSGRPLLTEWPIIGRFRNDSLPLGEFTVIDQTGNRSDPGIDELGKTHLLIYEEALT